MTDPLPPVVPADPLAPAPEATLAPGPSLRRRAPGGAPTLADDAAGGVGALRVGKATAEPERLRGDRQRMRAKLSVGLVALVLVIVAAVGAQRMYNGPAKTFTVDDTVRAVGAMAAKEGAALTLDENSDPTAAMSAGLSAVDSVAKDSSFVFRADSAAAPVTAAPVRPDIAPAPSVAARAGQLVAPLEQFLGPPASARPAAPTPAPAASTPVATRGEAGALPEAPFDPFGGTPAGGGAASDGGDGLLGGLAGGSPRGRDPLRRAARAKGQIEFKTAPAIEAYAARLSGTGAAGRAGSGSGAGGAARRGIPIGARVRARVVRDYPNAMSGEPIELVTTQPFAAGGVTIPAGTVIYASASSFNDGTATPRLILRASQWKLPDDSVLTLAATSYSPADARQGIQVPVDHRVVRRTQAVAGTALTAAATAMLASRIPQPPQPAAGTTVFVEAPSAVAIRQGVSDLQQQMQREVQRMTDGQQFLFRLAAGTLVDFVFGVGQ